MSIIETLKGYGMVEIGAITMPDATTFKIVLRDTSHGEWQKAIYAFVVGKKIMRIGSLKGKLRKRFQAWNTDVSNALRGNPHRSC
jgi:hypothetical protein